MQIERLPNESNSAYHKRLVYGKLADKTLSDIDYSELSYYAYGKEFSSDVARRMLYGSLRTLEILSQDVGVPAGDSTSDKLIEIQKERRQLFDQRRELNKVIASEGRREHLEQMLIQAAGNLKNTVGSVFNRDECYFECPVFERGVGSTEAILVFSDWHYGMKTSNVFNTYDTQICRKRVQQIVESAIVRLQRHQCSKLHLVVLGDLLHGAIHVGARVASEELVCDQIMQVSEILAQSIEHLSAYVPEIDVHITYGNHARTVQSKHDSLHRDNMERLIPWWIKQRMSSAANVNIVPDTESEFLFLNVCGHEFCASHGDLDSVKTSPRLLATLFQKKYGKDIEYILLGDKHHRESFNELGVTAMVCGSLCGTDNYASDKRLFSNPEQMMMIVDSESGVDAEYRLKCT